MNPPRASATPNPITEALSRAIAKLRGDSVAGSSASGDVPGAHDIEVLRDRNGTGEQADEEQLGVTEEEVKDLANDAEGG